MAMVFSKQRFDFVSKTRVEKLKKYSKNPNTVKRTCFWLNVLKNSVLIEKYSKSTKSRKMSQRK